MPLFILTSHKMAKVLVVKNEDAWLRCVERTEIDKALMTKTGSCFNNLVKLQRIMCPQSTLPIPPNDQVRVHRRMGGEAEVFLLLVPKEISQYLCADKTGYEAFLLGCAI